MSETRVPFDEIDSAYFQGLAEQRLLLQYCESCKRWQFYPRAICTACAGEIGWREAAGRGVVYAKTVVEMAPARFVDEAPYAVALIDLEEGVRVMARLTETTVEIDDPVEIVWPEIPATDASPPLHFGPVSTGRKAE